LDVPVTAVDRPLLLVDAASLYFRAYHGIPESAARAPDGAPVNAVRGFLDMLATLIRGRRPDRVICALDADWRPAWRVALLPSYKAHRLAPGGGQEEVVPDGLVPQIPVILDLLVALGIPALGAAGYEADDVLGTLATREPGPVEVVSGDRDLFQLVDDGKPVRLLYCGRGVAKLEVFDDAAIRARYGVPAAGYADFAALRGDPSDGLPGVAGIGEKTADTATSPASSPRRRTRRPASRPDCAPSWSRPATTSTSRPPSSGWPATSRCRSWTPDCPPRRPTRTGCSRWPTPGTSPARPGASSTPWPAEMSALAPLGRFSLPRCRRGRPG
jgi:hypothetical protein